MANGSSSVRQARGDADLVARRSHTFGRAAAMIKISSVRLLRGRVAEYFPYSDYLAAHTLQSPNLCGELKKNVLRFETFCRDYETRVEMCTTYPPEGNVGECPEL